MMLHVLLMGAFLTTGAFTSRSSLLDRAAALVERRSFSAAEKLLRLLPVEGDDQELKRDVLLARVLVGQKKFADAEPLLVRLIDKDPAIADRHLYELANARFQRGDFEGALQAVAGVDEQGLFAEDADVVRVAALAGVGRLDDAKLRCEQSVVTLSKSTAAKLHACGRVYAKSAMLGRAEEYLRFVVRHHPEKAEAILARAALRDLGASYGPHEQGDQAFGQAERALNRRRFDQATQAYRTALGLARDPISRAEAVYRLADLDERKLAYAQAIAGYQRAADSARGNELAAQALFSAGVLATRMKNLSLARGMYQRLLIEHPLAQGRSQALFGLGFTAFLGHDYEGARQFLSTLLTLDLARTEKQRARYWFGRTLEALTQTETSQVIYSEILRDDPAGYYAFRADERLAALLLPALELPFEAPPERSSLAGRVSAMVRRVVSLASRALRSDALRLLTQLARGHIPTQEDAIALRDAFLGLGERVKAEVVLMVWRYEHLGELSPEERMDTLRTRHPRFFADAIGKEAVRAGLKPAEVFAIIRQESRFVTTARSPAGARGLMQLMMPTAKEMARATRVQVPSPSSLFRPDLNLRLGTTYLARLMRAYPKKELAYAAYNAGPGNLARWMARFGDLPVDVFCELIPFTETRDYVQRVVGYARGYEMTERPALGAL